MHEINKIRYSIITFERIIVSIWPFSESKQEVLSIICGTRWQAPHLSWSPCLKVIANCYWGTHTFNWSTILTVHSFVNKSILSYFKFRYKLKPEWNHAPHEKKQRHPNPEWCITWKWNYSSYIGECKPPWGGWRTGWPWNSRNEAFWTTINNNSSKNQKEKCAQAQHHKLV